MLITLKLILFYILTACKILYIIFVNNFWATCKKFISHIESSSLIVKFSKFRVLYVFIFKTAYYTKFFKSDFD